MKYQDFTKKSYPHRAQWRYYLCEDIGMAMVTNIIFLFFIRILTFWNRKYKYYCLSLSFITLYPSIITFLWQAFAIGDHFNGTIFLFRKWIKKNFVLCRNFISVYKINRTSHGRLGIRLPVVPHLSSATVKRAKRECAWKSPHAREGDTRLAWGDFHARSRFARFAIPEEKWGTTRSLLGDTNFIFSCWKYPSFVRFADSWDILSALEDKIRIPARPCNILYIYLFL